jgi:dienelactone hydrolase
MHLTLSWLLVLLVAPPPGLTDPGRVIRARAFVEDLHKGAFARAGKHFAPAMQKALPLDKLEEVWRSAGKQFGRLEKIASAAPLKGRRAPTVALRCTFAKQAMTLLVVFDREDRIQGFFFQVPDAKFPPPPYARPAAFREEAVTVGAGGDWPLPGTLSLPRGAGPFPGVVLLHGSGPNDRDETIGANKPLRDLAWGLASRGVAVLRFEKRTRAHAARLAKDKLPATLKEEVTDDALAAAKLLRAHGRIDPKRVFVLGHSLGACAAPRVGQLDPALRGLVLLAGNSRPLEDLIVEQYTYLFSQGGGPTKEQKAELEQVKKQAAAVKGLREGGAPAAGLLLGAPARYWLALRAYDQKAVAARLTMPMLVLQGGRDYQVTMEDFAGWKKALAGRKNVTLKDYPALNHLFITGKGKSKPAEYALPGHVAAEVVEDVAAWVKKH